MVGTKRPKTEGDGNHTWIAREVAQCRAHWPLGTLLRLRMELAFELAAQRAEIVTRGRSMSGQRR